MDGPKMLISNQHSSTTASEMKASFTTMLQLFDK